MINIIMWTLLIAIGAPCAFALGALLISVILAALRIEL